MSKENIESHDILPSPFAPSMCCRCGAIGNEIRIKKCLPAQQPNEKGDSHD